MTKALDPAWREVPWPEALAGASAPVARALEKSLKGRELGLTDALTLAKANGRDLLALVKVADEVRRRDVGGIVTYVVNRNLNFTNICVVGCAFCGFSRGPKAKDAYFHSMDTLLAKAAEAAAHGASELCIQGGLPKNLDGRYYADLLRTLNGRFPSLHLHAYSPMEISYGVEKTEMKLPGYLMMLREAGLGSIPGTAAEILDDNVRGDLSPNKLKAGQWIETIRTAHRLGIPSTCTMMYGHTESPEHWVRHMNSLRDIQKETGGFTEFVPLAFVHADTRLYRKGGARGGSTLEEDLAVHALARLFFRGHIKNVQVSWVKLGFEGSLACLQAGANDFSGTLMEESISKAAGARFGEYVAPEEFRALIRSIGRVPAERTTAYEMRRIFADVEGEERWPAPPGNTVQMAAGIGY